MNQKIIERFWKKVKIGGPNDCWPWMGCKMKNGYGKHRADKKYGLVHRFAYELVKGKIPDCMEIDHLCRNRACCNPAHMEPVTHRENTLRGEGVTAKAARATHCPQGHPYDLENTYVAPNGNRQCRICRKEQSNIWYATHARKR